MSPHDSSLHCPSCQRVLEARVLVCEPCEIRVEGRFQTNEFATLAPEDLHFLRVFVHSEGRIREMETALGLSYPTIRNRLSALKNKLTTASQAAEDAAVRETESANIKHILAELESGRIPFEEAMKQLKTLREGKPSPKPRKSEKGVNK